MQGPPLAIQQHCGDCAPALFCGREFLGILRTDRADHEATISNSELRQSWIRDKGMQVLQFWSDAHRETSVDAFVAEPFAFDEEYAHALVTPLHDKLLIRFVSLPTLIRMKEAADRPQDRADIEQLRASKDNDAKR